MVQLNVIIVGTSPAETLRLEGALQQTQYLHRFKYISLEPAVNGSPNWNSWDRLNRALSRGDWSGSLVFVGPGPSPKHSAGPFFGRSV